MRLRYGSRLGIVSSRQSTTAELRLVDVLLEWTGYPSPPPAVSLRRRWNRTVEAPAMHVDGLSPCRTLAGKDCERRRASFVAAVREIKEGQEDSCPFRVHPPRLRRSRAITLVKGPGSKYRSRSIGRPSGPRTLSNSESTK